MIYEKFDFVFITACKDWSDRTGVAVVCDRRYGEWEATLTVSDAYGVFTNTLRRPARDRVEYPGRGHAQRRGETPEEFSARVHGRLSKMIAEMRRNRIRANQNRLAELPEIVQAIDEPLHTDAFPVPRGELPGAGALLESIDTVVELHARNRASA